MANAQQYYTGKNCYLAFPSVENTEKSLAATIMSIAQIDTSRFDEIATQIS
jgi:hypothetical protein